MVIGQSVNGNSPPKVYEVALEISGQTVCYIPISVVSLIMQMKRRAYPKPLPPLVMVEIFGEKKPERNYADPDYPDMVKQWEEVIDTKVMEIIYRRLENVQEPSEEKSKMAEVIRQEYGDDAYLLSPNDTVVWFYNVALADDRDARQLLKAVRTGGEPTEAAIKAHADAF